MSFRLLLRSMYKYERRERGSVDWKRLTRVGKYAPGSLC